MGRAFLVRAGTALVVVVSLAACRVGDQGDRRGENPREDLIEDSRGDSRQDPSDVPGTLEHENAVIDLWAVGTPAFGIFVPNEIPRTEEQRSSGERPPPVYTREGGERLARNPLYDFLFLNLEGGYDIESVVAIVAGLRSPSPVGRKTLLVRIPPIERDGEDAARTRVREILAAGADGVVFPHVQNPEEARAVVSFFREVGADVWSPSNPTGEIQLEIGIQMMGK